jgi:NAD kinase
MSRTLPPRVVVVTRPTDYEALLLRHATREQARFVVERRGGSFADVEARHAIAGRAVHVALAAVPRAWRRARLGRAELDRFLFEPEDVIVAVGQDGLVANVAKYLVGQPVIGVNPSREIFDGVLVRHPPEAVAELLAAEAAGRARVEERSMVEARTHDGQTLRALNELYVGHRTHQSSRYVLGFAGREERHSSSGLIVATGTGATGWARSVSLARVGAPPLPAATAAELAFFVREAWPSVRTGTTLVHGIIPPGGALEVVSEMHDDGVAFGDGIEGDRLELPFGLRLRLARAEVGLRLVV